MAVQVCLLAGHNRRGPEVLEYVEKMKPGHEVRLVREPGNRFDRNAIQVHAIDPEGGQMVMIGFIAKVHNRKAAEFMDLSPDNNPLPAVFGYAGTGKSRVPAIQITFPDEESAS